MTIETLGNDPNNRKDHQRESHKFANESFLKPESNFTNLRITINHWQLRDLVQSFSQDPSKILFTCKDQLRSYNYKTNKITNYCKLDFQPRCFAEQDDIIISGGVATSNHTSSGSPPLPSPSFNRTSSIPSAISSSKGLLHIYNKQLDISRSLTVGSLINNHVSLHKRSNYKYSSLVCNNDCYLYSCELNNRGDFSVLSESNLGFAVNHASLSPDKKHTVACGDSKKIVLLFDGQSTSSKLPVPSHKKVSLKTGYDSGFSTTFNADGKQFCCAFQDGVALVYDIRNYKKPLHVVYSTRPKSLHGLFRCCKFSGGTDDLLILSEHTGRVHMVDTRNYEKHQVVLLPKLIFAPGETANDGGVYHEPLVREYQDVLSNFNNIPDNIIRYNINNEFLYQSNGIASEVPSNNFDSASSDYNYFDEDLELKTASDLEDLEDWSEYDQELTSDSLRSSDVFYTNANGMFHVNNQFPGRRVSANRYSDDNSEFRLMYEDSLADINGIDWYCDPDTGRSHLLVGCEKGLFRWEINSWSRRCFPSFEVC